MKKTIVLFKILSFSLFLSNSILFAKTADPKKTETASFAAGCFWGTEEFFRKIPGVIKTQVGYTGGSTLNPKYEEMHDGHTGHAETVEIEFDPNQVSYNNLLDKFFKMHDPTTLNRQGNDTGNQYRSDIFYHNEKQKNEIITFKAKIEKSGVWKSPLTTEISEAKKFWPAENDHQQYLIKHPGGYDNHYLRNISFDKPASK
ncbi:MAG: peptide-methionine (S)-S-oxide reductase MsrA [Bacteriovorax sp.]|nr:peptide-methionine (S)-S-oxide reductase MsrA [Bacteriovorax sp.]